MKRRRKKLKIIISVTCVCVAGAGTFGYFKLAHTKPVMQETKTAQSAEAKKGNLSKTIVGTGNLELADALDQTAPSGLEISEVKVESGDEVEEGDVLAVVDESSILEAMEQVQDEISQLDESIQAYQDSDEENVIESSVSGRVKKINVSAGSDISDVMVSDGALMILSLDGKMSVTLTGVSDVSADDSVTVTLSSGTQVTGTVASVSGDSCEITLTDNGTTYGDTVTVTDSDGNELGSGELTVHQPLEITGTAGTVSAVNVSENASVSEGTTLLTLEGNANETEYQELLAKREARTATLKKLIELKADPEIKAEVSGTVQSVNVSEGSSTSSSSSGSTSSGSSTSGNSSSSGKTVSQMSYSSTASMPVELITLSTSNKSAELSASNASSVNNSGAVKTTSGTAAVVKCADTGETVSGSASVETDENENVVSLEADTSENTDTAVTPLASTSEEDFSEAEDSGIGDEAQTDTSVTLQFAITSAGDCTASSLAITAPVTEGTPVTSANASDGTYTGTIIWNPGDSTFNEKTVYQANVALTAGDGYVFSADSISQIAVGTVSGVTVSQDGKNLSFQITFPETAASSQNDGKTDDSGNNGNTDSGTNNGADSTGNADASITDGTSGNNSNQNSTDQNDADGTSGTTGGTSSDGNSSNGNNSGASSQNGTSSGARTAASASGTAGSAGDAATGTSQTSDDTSTESSAAELSASEYSTDVALFTISPDDTMTLEVSVDELDINSVETGQEATVTFDAIEDKEFTGEVTEIGSTASVNGGVAKYTVSISVPKDDQMKQGMNASATITIENRENVITIPVNALQEKGDKVFVYTEADDEGNLSGETEVTTGLSDGTTVEITDGLSEGDTVYYNKTGNTSDSSDSGMPGGDMGGFGGDMSDGGAPGGSSDSGNGGPGGSGGPGGNGGGTPPNM